MAPCGDSCPPRNPESTSGRWMEAGRIQNPVARMMSKSARIQNPTATNPPTLARIQNPVRVRTVKNGQNPESNGHQTAKIHNPVFQGSNFQGAAWWHLSIILHGVRRRARAARPESSAIRRARPASRIQNPVVHGRRPRGRIQNPLVPGVRPLSRIQIQRIPALGHSHVHKIRMPTPRLVIHPPGGQ